MENKHILRNLFYLGVGATAMATAYKAEELIGRLLKGNDDSVGKGSKIIKKYKEKAEKARIAIERKKDELVSLIGDKVEMSTKEIRQFLDYTMDKPHDAKRDLKLKIDTLSQQLSKTTKLSIAEGRKMIESIIDEFHSMQESIKTKTEQVIDTMQSKKKDLDSEVFFDDMGSKAIELREEMNKRAQKVIDDVRDKLHIASKARVDDLEHHIENLEHK